MKVWITCFILLFGASELFQWFREISLPLPFFVVGGVLLAIASNYDKLTHLPFHPDYEKSDSEQATPTIQSAQNAQPISPKKQQNQSISYEIHKPFQPGD